MKKTYPSKVSKGLLVILFLTFFTPLIPAYWETAITSETVIVIVILMLLYGFILWLFLTTKYSIKDHTITIACGPFKYAPIDIHTIRSIEKTNSLVSSPAASFDRISITYGKFDSILLSPADRNEFIKTLLDINPKIQVKLTQN